MSRYVVQIMYLEKLKRLIIWNGGECKVSFMIWWGGGGRRGGGAGGGGGFKFSFIIWSPPPPPRNFNLFHSSLAVIFH
jgi:hypothetical protein